MVSQQTVCGIAHGLPLATLEDMVNELELALVTVKDVIDRQEGAAFEDSYIAVNLGLYYQHTHAVLMRCRALLREPATQPGSSPCPLPDDASSGS